MAKGRALMQGTAKKSSPAIFGLALMCFFLPFVTVSCVILLEKKVIRGASLAGVNTPNSGFFFSHVRDGKNILFDRIIFLSASKSPNYQHRILYDDNHEH
jgi:hypothetical protein